MRYTVCHGSALLMLIGVSSVAANSNPQHPMMAAGAYRQQQDSGTPSGYSGYPQSGPPSSPRGYDYYGTVYGQNQQPNYPPPATGGILSKLKNSIFAVGSSLTDRRPEGYGPGTSTSTPEWGPPAGRAPYPPERDRDAAGYYGSVPVRGPYPGQTPEGGLFKTLDSGVKSAWGRLRSLVGPADLSGYGSSNDASNYGPYGYTERVSGQAPPPYPGYYQQSLQGAQQRGQNAPPMPNAAGPWPPAGRDAGGDRAAYPPAAPPYPIQPTADQAWNGESRRGDPRSADAVSSPLPDSSRLSGSAGDSASASAASSSSFFSDDAGRQYQSVPMPGDFTGQGQTVSETEPIAEGAATVPPEPQIFVSDGCIVLIPRPVEYFRKKRDIISAGSQQLNVFTDFERTMTSFRAPNGELSYSTMELLETSNALFPQATAHIRSVVEEYENNYPNEMNHALYVEMMEKIQDIISREGGLQMNYVSPATRAMQGKISLRDGWKEALEALAMRRVPAYIFSSGYGDIIAQMLLQNGLFGGRLPPNVRIISNFFRAAPDGSVKGFSKPIVHPGNKNATTASMHMDMPLPDRQYALVLGSEEQDIKMAEGSPGLREILSVGFLEMTEDLTGRLQSYLGTYDAVVLGDGSFKFCRSLIEELLQLGDTASGGKAKSTDSSGGGRRAGSGSQGRSLSSSFFEFTKF